MSIDTIYSIARGGFSVGGKGKIRYLYTYLGILLFNFYYMKPPLEKFLNLPPSIV